MIVLKYYGVIQNEIKVKKEIVYAISVHNSLNKGLMCAFFVASIGQIKCRSPPFINWIKKFKLIGGKKNGKKTNRMVYTRIPL